MMVFWHSLVVLALLLPGAHLAVATGPEDATAPARAAFERLKTLAGQWEGTTSTGEKGSVSYRVTAAGSVVIETDFPGTEHEMLTLYYLDGDRLVRKHHCVMGNQPEMTLDPQRSTQDTLFFGFSGGTNLDPAKDAHVHEGWVKFLEDGRMELDWTGFEGGKKAGANTFYLSRK